jgi:hypothetical protein
MGRFKETTTCFCYASLIIGLAGITGGLTWLLQPGHPVEMPSNAAMSVENLPPILERSNPGEPGTYRVAFLTYGSGEDQETQRIWLRSSSHYRTGGWFHFSGVMDRFQRKNAYTILWL